MRCGAAMMTSRLRTTSEALRGGATPVTCTVSVRGAATGSLAVAAAVGVTATAGGGDAGASCTPAAACGVQNAYAEPARLGVDRFLYQSGLNLPSLLIFAAIFGMGGSLISLLMSKWTAKRFSGAQVIEQPRNEVERWLVETVRRQAGAAAADDGSFPGDLGDLG